MEVDAGGQISYAGATSDRPGAAADAIDLRPWCCSRAWSTCTPICLRCRTPGSARGWTCLRGSSATSSRSSAGSGRGRRATSPPRPSCHRRRRDDDVAGYGAYLAGQSRRRFAAAEAQGTSAIVGKVMMDRITYDPTDQPSDLSSTGRSPRSARLIRALAWGGRQSSSATPLTPRFAVFVHGRPAARIPRPSPASTGAYWQTHVFRGPWRDRRGRVSCSPRRFDYVDVYDRAGGLSKRTVLAHAVHISNHELAIGDG